jgi:hypothetical protein
MLDKNVIIYNLIFFFNHIWNKKKTHQEPKQGSQHRKYVLMR